MSLWDAVGETCRAVEADLVAITSATPFSVTGRRYRYHDPARVLPGARSILLLLRSHALDRPEASGQATICSSYATGHFTGLAAEAARLVRVVGSHGHRAIAHGQGGRNIPLKQAAIRAGIGWYGRNTLLITEQFGSFVALGGLITDAELEPAVFRVSDSGLARIPPAGPEPLSSRCGPCRRCQVACPTRSLDQPYTLTRATCLANISITAGDLSEDVARLMGTRLLGCDTCQDVCPYNEAIVRRPVPTVVPGRGLLTRNELDTLRSRPEQWQKMARALGVSRRILDRNVDMVMQCITI